MNTVLDQFDPTKHYFKDPYPHIIIEDCLPQNLYNDLYNSFPVEEITRGLIPALTEFLETHKEWVLHKHYTNNNGLTILKRLS